MTKINTTLQKPNPKGTPPTPAATPDIFFAHVIGENVPFQVRIPPAAKREFKAYAAARDLHSSHLISKSLGVLQGAPRLSMLAYMHASMLRVG